MSHLHFAAEMLIFPEVITTVGRFLPVSGKTFFFHGKTVVAKIVFASKYSFST